MTNTRIGVIATMCLLATSGYAAAQIHGSSPAVHTVKYDYYYQDETESSPSDAQTEVADEDVAPIASGDCAAGCCDDGCDGGCAGGLGLSGCDLFSCNLGCPHELFGSHGKLSAGGWTQIG